MKSALLIIVAVGIVVFLSFSSLRESFTSIDRELLLGQGGSFRPPGSQSTSKKKPPPPTPLCDCNSQGNPYTREIPVDCDKDGDPDAIRFCTRWCFSNKKCQFTVETSGEGKSKSIKTLNGIYSSWNCDDPCKPRP